MHKLKLLLFVSVALCGCTSLESVSESSQYEQTHNMNVYHDKNESSRAALVAADQVTPLEASENFQNHYKNKFSSDNEISGKLNLQHTNINQYVQSIMQDLVSNLKSVSSSTTMAVTNFVYLDSDYESSDLLGKQIAESFIHEIHKFGIPIVDFKTSDYLRVTDSGDFVLSKDFLELQTNFSIKYVLLGTLTRSVGGVLVNARIVGMQSKAVVASAQGFLPSAVTRALLKSDLNHGVKLIGE